MQPPYSVGPVAPPARKSFVMQRLKPGLALGLGLVIMVFNFVFLLLTEHFFVFGLYLGCAMVSVSGFGVVVGEPEDVYGNRPMWFKIGIVASLIAGLLIALVLHIELTVD